MVVLFNKIYYAIDFIIWLVETIEVEKVQRAVSQRCWQRTPVLCRSHCAEVNNLRNMVKR